MKKRLVLTIDETNEGKHGITLDDGDMCYGIKFDLNIRYIEKMNAIGIARYMIEVLNNNPISVFCSASRLNEEIKRHSCISPWQYNHVIQRLWTL